MTKTTPKTSVTIRNKNTGKTVTLNKKPSEKLYPSSKRLA